MNAKDKEIVREFAKRYMEFASSEEQLKTTQRMQDTNDLKIVRPPVLIDEFPWAQMMGFDKDLPCQCEDPAARRVEAYFRGILFLRKHFRADLNTEPFFRVTMAYDSTGIGITRKEETLSTNHKTNIVSHKYEDLLEDEDSVELIQIPTFTPRPDKDEKAMEFYTDLLGDSIPVKLCGLGPIVHNAWDKIVNLRGMEPVLYDLYDRPEHLHALRKRLLDVTIAEMDFRESCMKTDPTSPIIHRTPARVSGLAEDGLKATWLRTQAQPFSEISPEMHEEFDINYTLQIADRFGYTYYGCCEPLDQKLDIVCKIPNLRKIGVTPWAKEEIMAERMGGKYVYSRKPNPANVAVKTDPEVVRKETETTVKLCQKYGCPVEFILKDISTFSSRPENLIVWANTVADVLDAYYGQ